MNILIFLTLLLTPYFAKAQASKSTGGRYDFRQRAEVRTQKRWTLKEWLDGKERMQMMDLWLAMNSPSPYEFYMGATHNSYSLTTATPTSTTTPQTHVSYAGVASAYARLIGVGVEYENNTKESYNDLNGLFHLRLWGNSVQSSALTLSYGLRTRNGTSVAGTTYRLNNQFGDAHLQLYLQKVFGIEGRYRSYLPYSESTFGDTKGNLTEGGVFIDFEAFRIYGLWYQDRTQSTLSNIETQTEKTGIKSGFKIFF